MFAPLSIRSATYSLRRPDVIRSPCLPSAVLIANPTVNFSRILITAQTSTFSVADATEQLFGAWTPPKLCAALAIHITPALSC